MNTTNAAPMPGDAAAENAAPFVPGVGAAPPAADASIPSDAGASTTPIYPAPEPWPIDEHDPLGVYAPPDAPERYELPPLNPNEPVDIASVREAQALFYAAGIDPVTAKIVWTEALGALAQPLTDVEVELGAARTRAYFAGRHGEQLGAERIKLAQAEVQRIAKVEPRVLTWLDETGLGNNAMVIERLATIGEIRAKRGGGTKVTTNSIPAATTAPATAPRNSSEAAARKAALMQHQAWVQRWANGDADARAEMFQLNKQIAGEA